MMVKKTEVRIAVCEVWLGRVASGVTKLQEMLTYCRKTNSYSNEEEPEEFHKLRENVGNAIENDLLQIEKRQVLLYHSDPL